jgi:phosphoenolpyruvate synthase/pyruvate phosphate dikinase
MRFTRFFRKVGLGDVALGGGKNASLGEQLSKLSPVFDGFCIGSNDLTQLTLGVDRDSVTVAPFFDERNEAMKWSCARLVEVAHAAGRKVGICGPAPSDFPDFAAFLRSQGIDWSSLNADALARTILRVVQVERELRPGLPQSTTSTPRLQSFVCGAQ